MQNCFFVAYLKPASVAVCLCKAHFHPQPFFLVQQIFLCKEDPRPLDMHLHHSTFRLLSCKLALSLFTSVQATQPTSRALSDLLQMAG